MAEFKNTTIDDTAALKLPAGSTADRPGSPQSGMIRYNTDLDQTEFYDGSTWSTLFAGSSGSGASVEATGGTVVDTTIAGVDYRIHFFTQTGSDNFVVSAAGEVEYLIVAGGGGGSMAGGGAGGLLTGFTTVTPQTYTITVGVGGNQSTNTRAFRGTDGGNSSAFGLTAIGGGAGGAYGDEGVAVRTGNPGGSGGGGGGLYTNQTNTAGGSGTAGQGNDGGQSENVVNGTAGGGGGAGSPGLDGSQDGYGGNGVTSSISGTSRFYAGGGAGGVVFGELNRGGLGGGGAGGRYSPFFEAFNGTVNTGGGGGGGSEGASPQNNAGSGGSGIVIVRYRRVASPATSADRTAITTQPNNYQIINSNLRWYVDAGNVLSYPGTGTTLTNIGPSGFNGTLRNSPTFESDKGGYFVIGGTQDIITGTTPPSLQGNPNLTVSGWFRRLSDNPTARGTWGIGGNVTNQGINSWWYNNTNEIAIDVWSSGTFTTNVEYPLGEWVFVTWQKIAGAMSRANCILWRNLESYTGTQLTILRAETGNPAINNVGITIGRISPTFSQLTTSGWEFGEFFIYDRVLTDNEVAHNFNVTRWRYGV